MTETRKPISLPALRQRKSRGEKFACLTAYDASFARILDDAGVEVILVGDSLGMVIQGQKTTLPVTLEEMIYHTRAVSRGVSYAMIMADLPFMADVTAEDAVRSAARLMKEGGAQIIKLEGGIELEPVIRRLSQMGVPTCAHLGLRPQSVYKLGGYKVQGRDADDAREMIEVAQQLEKAGADIILLECVVQDVAQRLAQSVSVPVIGIGAGKNVDAQVLVLYDMLGITPGKRPVFSRNFLEGADSVADAVVRYRQAVLDGTFPAPDQAFD